MRSRKETINSASRRLRTNRRRLLNTTRDFPAALGPPGHLPSLASLVRVILIYDSRVLPGTESGRLHPAICQGESRPDFFCINRMSPGVALVPKRAEKYEKKGHKHKDRCDR